MAVPRPSAEAALAAATPSPWANFDPVSAGPAQIIAAPAAPFLLRWRPDLWEVASKGLEGPELLPVVTAHIMQAGINGVHQVGKSFPTFELAGADAMAKDQRNGWRYLPHNVPIEAKFLPASVAPGPYLRRCDCIHPLRGSMGVYYHEAWCTFEPELDQRPHRAVWHMAERNRWLLHLRQQGVFGTPADQVVARLAKQAGVSIDSIRGSALVTAEVRDELLKDRRGRVAAVEQAAERARRPAAAKGEATP